MKRLLLDQGLPRSPASLLPEAGSDAIHVADIGMSRSSDAEILYRARAEAPLRVTLDADFHTLLATGGERGLSARRIRKEGLDAAALASLSQGIWAGVEDGLDDGALVTITGRSVRVRRLPVFRD